VQRARDSSAAKWLMRSEFLAKCHEPWHLCLGKSDLVSAVFG
jgi:hypothetical protein